MPGWQVVRTPLAELHVVPVGEEHDCSMECWCGPTPEVLATHPVLVHHARDRREFTVERQ
jgi:hypothetical protein